MNAPKQSTIAELIGTDVLNTLDEQQKAVLNFADRMVERMREKGTDDSEEAQQGLFDIPMSKIISGIISNASQVLKGHEKGEYARTGILDLANYAYICDTQQSNN